MGHGAWGMGHRAWGMGHGAWGMGHRAYLQRFPMLRGTVAAINKAYF